MEERIEIADEITAQNLKKITDTQEKLTHIKSALNTVIDSVQNNPSLIQRFATNWSEASAVGKLTTGGITILPGLATPVLKTMGILLIPGYGVGALAALSLGSLTFYLALSEHNEKSIETKLKNGILSIGDILEVVISNLNEISQDLTKQVDILKSENIKLSKSVINLESNIADFTGQIETFTITNSFLNEQKAILEQQIADLTINFDQNETMIKKQEQILHDFTLDQERNQSALDNTMMELDVVKKTMSLELEKAKKVSGMLQSTVDMLSKTSIKNEADRQVFNEKMHDIFTKSENEIQAVNSRIYDMEKQFETLLGELKQSNTLYQEILKKEQQQLTVLEGLSATPQTTEARTFLNSFSIFKPWSAFPTVNLNSMRSSNCP